mgnify:CR=1 FL=1
MADSLKGLRTFTNADVARASRPTLGVRRDTGTADRPLYQPDPMEQVSVEDILADAQRHLEQAPDYSDVAALPESLAALRESRRPSLRSLTEGASKFGGAVALASMIPGPQSPVLAGVGTALMAPNALRHLLAPEEDETRLGGLVEAGMALGPAAVSRGMRAIKGSRAISVPPGLGMGYGSKATHLPATSEAVSRASNLESLGAGVEPLDEAVQQVLPAAWATLPKAKSLVTPAPKRVGEGAGRPSLKALRHTKGQAARDLGTSTAERRVNLSGALPPGMTERRMDELIARFGGKKRAS